jgi:hypothetical protein
MKYEYDQLARSSQVREKISRVIEVGFPEVLRGKTSVALHPEGVLGTVHVDDIVFARFLYQLVDYYQKSGGPGGSGRRFSQRYGIIGQAWRLRKSVGRGNAFSPIPPNPTPSQKMEWELKTKLQLIEE